MPRNDQTGRVCESSKDIFSFSIPQKQTVFANSSQQINSGLTPKANLVQSQRVVLYTATPHPYNNGPQKITNASVRTTVLSRGDLELNLDGDELTLPSNRQKPDKTSEPSRSQNPKLKSSNGSHCNSNKKTKASNSECIKQFPINSDFKLTEKSKLSKIKTILFSSHVNQKIKVQILPKQEKKLFKTTKQLLWTDSFIENKEQTISKMELEDRLMRPPHPRLDTFSMTSKLANPKIKELLHVSHKSGGLQNFLTVQKLKTDSQVTESDTVYSLELSK